jgi:hypothetical protein
MMVHGDPCELSVVTAWLVKAIPDGLIIAFLFVGRYSL